MKGTWVWSPVREDPTCCGATKSVSHNYWSPCATTTEARVPRARDPQQEKPLQWEACALQRKSSPRSLQLEKAPMQQWRPNTAPKNNNKWINKLINFKKKKRIGGGKDLGLADVSYFI